MTNYRRGYVAETERLEYWKAKGWSAARTAGSHGVQDIIAWNEFQYRHEQLKRVKHGNYYPDKIELAKFRDMKVPPNASKWIVIRKDGSKEWTEIRLE